jgi:hypothetical protein
MAKWGIRIEQALADFRSACTDKSYAEPAEYASRLFRERAAAQNNQTAYFADLRLADIWDSNAAAARKEKAKAPVTK